MNAKANTVTHLSQFRPVRRIALLGVAALGLCLATHATGAGSPGRSGKEVVEAVCVNCHGTGVKGAPKIGDKKAWAERSEQGLSGLTQHALSGIREMPAHGGNPGLSDVEIGRAITYMVNQSGGHWTEPTNKAFKYPERSGQEIVKARCAECHSTGKNGAPKIGDRPAWIQRIRQGLDGVVLSAIKGHGGMPARGGMPDLTDSEIRNAILFMFTQTEESAKNL